MTRFSATLGESITWSRHGDCLRPRSARGLYPFVKRFIFALGLLGLIGCFLPLTMGVSLFDLRHFDSGWHVWLVLAAFALPTYVGATETDKSAAIAGSISFGYLTYKFGTGLFDLVFHASIGGS